VSKISAGIFAASLVFLIVPQGRAASVSICNGVAGNLVTNCGFEKGDFTGWTLSGNDVPGQEGVLYGVEAGQDPVDSIFPNSGTSQAFFADLVANATTLSQTLSTTPGGQYSVALFLAEDTAATGTCNAVPCANEFTATLDGITIDNFTDVPVEGYTEYSGTVNVTDASSVLDITLGNDLGQFLLDDVIVATPEPSAWQLALGGMMFGSWAFRRKLFK